MPGLLSAGEPTRSELDGLMASARCYREGKGERHPEAVLGLAFYADSLRTRAGFAAAAARLGARTVAVFERRHDAMSEPESTIDALRSVADWFDALCLRHASAEIVAEAARELETPVVNCGDGDREHPSQAFIDLFAISEQIGAVDGLKIGIIGDLDGMRTAHSLALALANYEGVEVRAMCPPGLELPDRYRSALVAAGHAVEDLHALDLRGLDVAYVAGLPAETKIGHLDDTARSAFRVGPEAAVALNARGRILCPLPRVDEIDDALDSSAEAGYFEQSSQGIWMRMAVLDRVLR